MHWPCVGVSLRKARYSYDNIVARKAFTVNVPSEKYVRETDFFGIVSGRKKDKFAASGSINFLISGICFFLFV